jgi:hypothetical protein
MKASPTRESTRQAIKDGSAHSSIVMTVGPRCGIVAGRPASAEA